MVTIDAMDVRGLDLNLLIPLRVLLTERHVTRAAEKLGITQPAMSASLARLRALFGDQLLVARGYRVTPQVKTGAYRIDLVVEGSGDARLAVECDGDEFHGYDRWQHDTSRQRVLERAGWTFWRCFASTWILRKDEVFVELLERLTVLGIEPIGAIDRAPGLVEKRTWRPPEVVVTAVTPSVQQIADAGE